MSLFYHFQNVSSAFHIFFFYGFLTHVFLRWSRNLPLPRLKTHAHFFNNACVLWLCRIRFTGPMQVVAGRCAEYREREWIRFKIKTVSFVFVRKNSFTLLPLFPRPFSPGGPGGPTGPRSPFSPLNPIGPLKLQATNTLYSQNTCVRVVVNATPSSGRSNGVCKKYIKNK